MQFYLFFFFRFPTTEQSYDVTTASQLLRQPLRPDAAVLQHRRGFATATKQQGIPQIDNFKPEIHQRQDEHDVAAEAERCDQLRHVTPPSVRFPVDS